MGNLLSQKHDGLEILGRSILNADYMLVGDDEDMRLGETPVSQR